MRDGGQRMITLYLIFADRDYAGPGLLKLADLLRETAAEGCARVEAARSSASGEGLAPPETAVAKRKRRRN
jgi:hypothetical protein